MLCTSILLPSYLNEKCYENQYFHFEKLVMAMVPKWSFLHVLNDSKLLRVWDIIYLALFLLFERKCIFYLVTQIVIWKMVSHQAVTGCNQIDTRASQLPKVNEFSSFKWGKLGEIFYWIFLWMIFLCSDFIK